MFNKIVVALDGSPEAATSLPLAAMLARGRAASLLLVQVCEYYLPDSPAQTIANDYLTSFAAGLMADGLRVETEVRYGDVAEQIVAAARQHKADLVVLTTHGRHGLARAWYGSVTEDVVAKSPVPVLVLRADEAPPRQLHTLLVPLDETPGSAAALAIARAVAVVPGASLVLLRVVPPLPRWGEGWDVNPEWDAVMQRGAQGALDEIVRDLLQHGIPARGRAVIGPVAETIATQAEEVGADLIVMGTRALVGPRRALFGSVADAVVRTAARPVLLIRQNDQAGPEAGVDDDAYGRDEARPDVVPGRS
jgi:nucleotide-binding universal stress UspA family protein